MSLFTTFEKKTAVSNNRGSSISQLPTLKRIPSGSFLLPMLALRSPTNAGVMQLKEFDKTSPGATLLSEGLRRESSDIFGQKKTNFPVLSSPDCKRSSSLSILKQTFSKERKSLMPMLFSTIDLESSIPESEHPSQFGVLVSPKANFITLNETKSHIVRKSEAFKTANKNFMQELLNGCMDSPSTTTSPPQARKSQFTEQRKSMVKLEKLADRNKSIRQEKKSIDNPFAVYKPGSLTKEEILNELSNIKKERLESLNSNAPISNFKPEEFLANTPITASQKAKISEKFFKHKIQDLIEEKKQPYNENEMQLEKEIVEHIFNEHNIQVPSGVPTSKNLKLHVIEAVHRLEEMGLRPEEALSRDVFPKVAYSRAGSQQFINSVKRGDTEQVSKFLKSNPNFIYDYDNVGQTALHWAVKRERYEIAKMILGLKPNVNARDLGGKTPLFIAAKKGNLQFVKLLLCYKAKPDIPSHQNKKPMQVATDSLVQSYLRKAELLQICLRMCPKPSRKDIWEQEGLKYFRSPTHIEEGF